MKQLKKEVTQTVTCRQGRAADDGVIPAMLSIMNTLCSAITPTRSISKRLEEQLGPQWRKQCCQAKWECYAIVAICRGAWTAKERTEVIDVLANGNNIWSIGGRNSTPKHWSPATHVYTIFLCNIAECQFIFQFSICGDMGICRSMHLTFTIHSSSTRSWLIRG